MGTLYYIIKRKNDNLAVGLEIGKAYYRADDVAQTINELLQALEKLNEYNMPDPRQTTRDEKFGVVDFLYELPNYNFSQLKRFLRYLPTGALLEISKIVTATGWLNEFLRALLEFLENAKTIPEGDIDDDEVWLDGKPHKLIIINEEEW